MGKRKTYGEILEKLWAKYKGKKSYIEVQKMVKDVISTRDKAAEEKRIAKEKTIKEKATSGGQTFSRDFKPKGEYT